MPVAFKLFKCPQAKGKSVLKKKKWKHFSKTKHSGGNLGTEWDKAGCRSTDSII